MGMNGSVRILEDVIVNVITCFHVYVCCEWFAVFLLL